jgi:hypothetical protein
LEKENIFWSKFQKEIFYSRFDFFEKNKVDLFLLRKELGLKEDF